MSRSIIKGIEKKVIINEKRYYSSTGFALIYDDYLNDQGIISKKIKGLAGFGYDAIFYVVEEGKTFVENFQPWREFFPGEELNIELE